jgi:hypothetical protein
VVADDRLGSEFGHGTQRGARLSGGGGGQVGQGGRSPWLRDCGAKGNLRRFTVSSSISNPIFFLESLAVFEEYVDL